MDVAYDHIQEESFPDDEQKSNSNTTGESSQQRPATDFNSDVQDAFKAISSSPWAARIGGFWGSVRKQVGVYRRNMLIQEQVVSSLVF